METMFMQNFGGKTKSIMVFLKVTYCPDARGSLGFVVAPFYI